MRNKIAFLIIPVVLLIAVGAAGAMWYRSAATTETADDIAASDMSGQQPTLVAEDGTPVATPVDSQMAPASGEAATEETHSHDHSAEVATDVAADTAAGPAPESLTVIVEGGEPKLPRSVGRADAPVTIVEYASLTCPHCAEAHKTVVPRLIKDYVETGKARLVFSDFPLNQQALDATKVARCMPNDRYFSFMTLLFGSIEQWAYSNNHPNALIQNAVLAGLPEDKARSCMSDIVVEQAIIGSVQEAAKKYNVNATPTFVINDGAKVISGARPYEEFKAAIDPLVTAPAAQ